MDFAVCALIFLCSEMCDYVVAVGDSELDFCLRPGVEPFPDEMEMRLRCQRLVAAGVWVAKQFPRLDSVHCRDA